MPRAFLIKAKKEKKKEEEQASQLEHQLGQFSNEVAGELNASMLREFIGQTSSKFSPSLQSHLAPVVSKVRHV